uniref:Uncharacterized protein n=1 Tax=Anguilla anguilla TaxID=7936 RepID=A0A0E9W9P5_ANGAN
MHTVNTDAIFEYVLKRITLKCSFCNLKYIFCTV